MPNFFLQFSQVKEKRRCVAHCRTSNLENHSLHLIISCSICGGGYPCFELSAVNADKPPLEISQIKDRVKQFEKVGKILKYDALHTQIVRVENGCIDLFF